MSPNIYWFKAVALEAEADLPVLGAVASGIVAALEQFRAIEVNLKE